MVLRHGHAVKRSAWSGEDSERPLDTLGVEQSDVLVDRIAAYGVQRIHTSAARRCVQSVTPYAERAGLPVVYEPALTESAYEEAPAAGNERAAGLLADSVRSGQPTVLCGHRPYLPELIDHLLEGSGLTAPARHSAGRLDDRVAPSPGLGAQHHCRPRTPHRSNHRVRTSPQIRERDTFISLCVPFATLSGTDRPERVEFGTRRVMRVTFSREWWAGCGRAGVVYLAFTLTLPAGQRDFPDSAPVIHPAFTNGPPTVRLTSLAFAATDVNQ